MVGGAEKVEEAGVGVEESESASSSSLGRRALLLGEFDLFLCLVLRAPLVTEVGVAAESACEVTDDSAR
jgi:hypothetical protein